VNQILLEAKFGKKKFGNWQEKKELSKEGVLKERIVTGMSFLGSNPSWGRERREAKKKRGTY